VRGGLAGYAWVFATVALTVYGQIVFKWRIDFAGSLPGGLGGKAEWAVALLLDPWVVSVFAAALLASLTWAAALTHFELSFAYPFMSLSFVLVLVLSGLLFAEAVTPVKVVGIVLIVAGIVVGSQ
jgi:multidrug transporter EmrE-like cation transporter